MPVRSDKGYFVKSTAVADERLFKSFFHVSFKSREIKPSLRSEASG
jgi:hypothetical protein